MPSLQVRGATLDYDVTGDSGPLVVQLHGLTSSRARDAQLGLDLGRALRGHRVLRYDARAHGRSSGTHREADYGWDALARDLLALLDHVAPGERVHGVGPSMGAGTLLHAAVADPGRFASLTLVTPPTAWKRRRAQGDLYRANADLVERGGLAAFLALGDTAPVPPALADAPETRPAIPPELLPIVLRGAASTDLPRKKKVARIAARTLVLAWTGDRTHPLKTARTLRELIDGSRLIVARSPYGVMAWPGLFAEHVVTRG
ncbi:alpha/beta hydrolase [Microbacterium sp. NPDC089189]|uniref:alpha/beta fold hydrolase n=1 Tax=Microbacterium sp. NPDC089189 TaxID=3154972 RepID=UPI003447DD74